MVEPVFIPSEQMDFGSPFPHGGISSQPKYMGEVLDSALNDVTDLDDTPWNASVSLGSKWGLGQVRGSLGCMGW